MRGPNARLPHTLTFRRDEAAFGWRRLCGIFTQFMASAAAAKGRSVLALLIAAFTLLFSAAPDSLWTAEHGADDSTVSVAGQHDGSLVSRHEQSSVPSPRRDRSNPDPVRFDPVMVVDHAWDPWPTPITSVTAGMRRIRSQHARGPPAVG
ncbi:hypothetical protein [Nannocystis bainbridge]|uniref:Uncharacterized protein n=1 Tax=Nannocystis bainbridge TaxID=2995303 RepID=A0ABT5DSG4_9BACT|nr:hypothetical protein [Nannocystis bainbridge]MDC0716587.1 hypothetical protein [Nannocystis bainbridge]